MRNEEEDGTGVEINIVHSNTTHVYTRTQRSSLKHRHPRRQRVKHAFATLRKQNVRKQNVSSHAVLPESTTTGNAQMGLRFNGKRKQKREPEQSDNFGAEGSNAGAHYAKRQKRIEQANMAPIGQQKLKTSVKTPASDVHHESHYLSSTAWENLQLSSRLINQLRFLGYNKPTHVQAEAVHTLLNLEQDCLICATPGSGKTLAYMCAIVHSLSTKETRVRRADGPKAIVLAPTRELAIQIHCSVVEKLLRAFHWIVGGTICGGMKRKAEKERLRRGLNVLVATPGRFQDHLNHTYALSLSTLEWLVLDEADRLLDLGFEKIIREICMKIRSASTSENLTTCLVSATLAQGVERIASVGLSRSAARINVTQQKLSENGNEGAQRLLAPPPSSVKQRVLTVPTKRRHACLLGLLRKYMRASEKVMLFVSCCESVEFHSVLLSQLASYFLENATVMGLHGNVKHSERMKIFDKFKFNPGGKAVLVCTDVAARGIDVPDIAAMIQYDPSGSIEDYVHRIGRAGRMGREAEAVLFQTPEEAYVEALLHAVGEQGRKMMQIEYVNQEQLSNEVLGALPVHESKPPAGTPIEHDPRAITASKLIEQCVQRSQTLYSKAKSALVAHMRAYAAHPRALKKYLPLKALHKGHVAASLGLLESPKHVVQQRPRIFP